MYQWDFSVVFTYWRQLAQGLVLTVNVTLLAYLVGITLAVPVVLLRLSRNGFLRRLAVIYIEVFRGVPLLVLLVWGYYALPIVTGWELSAFWIGVVGIGVNLSAFVAEDYRAGIWSVPRGHVEAARGLGMSSSATFRRIVFPQAIRVVLGPLLNAFTLTLKGSALLLVLAVPELMYVAERLTQVTFRPLELLSVVAFVYLAVILPIGFVVRRLQRSFARELGR